MDRILKFYGNYFHVKLIFLMAKDSSLENWIIIQVDFFSKTSWQEMLLNVFKIELFHFWKELFLKEFLIGFWQLAEFELFFDSLSFH